MAGKLANIGCQDTWSAIYIYIVIISQLKTNIFAITVVAIPSPSSQQSHHDSMIKSNPIMTI